MDKKKLLIIVGVISVIIIILVVLLVVFSSRDDNNINPSGPTTDRNTNTGGNDKVINYWGLWEPNEVMQPIIDEYEANNPGIKINYVRKSFVQYEESVYFQLAEPASPDIVRIHNTWTYKLEDRLSSLPSNVMDSQTYSSTFFPIATKSFTGSDGSIYAIPWEVDGLALYYNKSLFAEAGLTEAPVDWDEFTEYSKLLTKVEGTTIFQAGAAIGSANNIRHADEIIGLLLLQNSTSITSGGKIDLSDNRFVPTMKFYTNFVTEHKVWSDGFDDDMQMFIQGRLAMMFAPSWRVFDIKLANPNLDFDMVPVPQIVGNTNPVYYADYWGDAVSRNSKYQNEAWDFVYYLSTPEVMEQIYNNSIEFDQRIFGEPYSRMDMADKIKGDKYVGTVIEMAPNFEQIPMLDKATLQELFYPIVDRILSTANIDNNTLSTIENELNQKMSVN